MCKPSTSILALDFWTLNTWINVESMSSPNDFVPMFGVPHWHPNFEIMADRT